jgi:hypothetical protein
MDTHVSGKVSVVTEPRARVSIDGQGYGITPLSTPVSLSPGGHVLELTNRKLGIRYRQKLRVRAGQHVKVTKTFERGALMVLALPFGEVFVDGQSMGLTPLEVPVSLFEGEHDVRVVCEQTGQEMVTRIRIEPGRTARVNADLR